MRQVFAGTFYWVALLDPTDNAHEEALNAEATLAQTQLITSEAVLCETLNHFSGYGSYWRALSARAVRRILENDLVEVRPTNRQIFQRGIELYEARLDKRYSLTDCMSMCGMRSLEIFEVLTHDAHFRQEGFVTLL